MLARRRDRAAPGRPKISSSGERRRKSAGCERTPLDRRPCLLAHTVLEDDALQHPLVDTYMPSPTQLSRHLTRQLPPSFAERFRQSVALKASACEASSHIASCVDEADPDSDEEAERILEEYRERRRQVRKTHRLALGAPAAPHVVVSVRARARVRRIPLSPQQEAEAQAERAAHEEIMRDAQVMQPYWGAALRAEVMRRHVERCEAAKASARSGVRRAAQAALQAAAASDSGTAAAVLSDADVLMALHAWREVETLGADPPTDGALRDFSECAVVSRAWCAAIRPVVRRRVVLRYARMFAHAPRVLAGFCRPSFVDLCGPSDELVVAQNHCLALVPSPMLSVGREPRAFVASEARSIGTREGHGGSELGELYHPHGVVVTPEGSDVYVADRSNHRVQRLRLADGAPLDCTAPGALWCPYGLALRRHALYVCDANHDRIVVLDASDLGQPPRLTFGSSGALPGELDKPVRETTPAPEPLGLFARAHRCC